MKDKEPPRSPEKFAGIIEMMASYEARGITVRTLRDLNDSDGVGAYRVLDGIITDNSLWDQVHKRAGVIKRQMEKEATKAPKPVAKNNGRRPLQMSLSEAHPQAINDWMQLENLGTSASEGIFDPEANINAMHYRRRLPKILQSDFDHWWRQQLKAWGFTRANKRIRLDLATDIAIDHISRAGLSRLVGKKNITIEEIDLIRKALSGYK